MKKIAFLPAAILLLVSYAAIHAADSGPATKLQKVETNKVAEVSLVSGTSYENPFMEVKLDAIFTEPDGTQLRVPAFWAGGERWCFRYSSAMPGMHRWRTECSDKSNGNLLGAEGEIEVVPYHGDNPLYQHGLVRVASDKRHFEQADGTPFIWLGDTWWKCMCKRMPWEGFQELTADRKAKGFSVVQIVCGGNYPDEVFESRWENEGGKPYETKDFSVVNPVYFDYADRRIRCLVEAGISPAIVGAWGRPQGGSPSPMSIVGVAGYERHWRYLIARYGAYPTIWIVGCEASGPEWSEVTEYVRKTDPYHHMMTMHPPSPPNTARDSVTENLIDFDMLQTGHGDWTAAYTAIAKVKAGLARKPPMPVLDGEVCYEGHMQTGLQDEQRYVFWGCMLSGAPGLTYGAAGIWQASVEGDPGVYPIYDWTPWNVSMNYPGSAQMGLGKKLLEQYPWSRFEPHPEWVNPDCFAAGIPGEVRFIYQPKRNIYNWNGPVVKNLEPDVNWHVYYFDPVTGRKFDEGTIKASAKAGDTTAKPIRYGHDVPSPQDWVMVLERVKG